MYLDCGASETVVKMTAIFAIRMFIVLLIDRHVFSFRSHAYEYQFYQCICS